jgi:hypothetical protein
MRFVKNLLIAISLTGTGTGTQALFHDCVTLANNFAPSGLKFLDICIVCLQHRC